MSEKFKSLPIERQKKILDAAIFEFAKKGYESASTNVIVKNAGVSKGILFHYFGNKKTLYLYLLDYISEYMTKKFYASFQIDSEDIFKRVIDWTIVKINLFYEEPIMSQFLMMIYKDMPKELKQEIEIRYQQNYQETMPSFLQGVDMTKFRKEVDPQKAIELLFMIIEGIGKRFEQKYKDRMYEHYLEEADQILKELKEYMEILKKGMYDVVPNE